MLSITIGITDKRVISTKTTMTSSVNLTCKLKEPTSMRNPVFIVSGLTKTTHYNYCSWNGFYYYVNDIIHITNNIQEVHCSIDPLATFKTAINNTYGYCLYGDATHKTTYIDDVRFGPDIKLSRSSGTGITGIDMGFDISHWSVVMTVQTTGTTFSYSGVLVAAMSISTFYALLKGLSGVVLSDISSWSSVDLIDILKNYALRVFTGGIQALDNIRSCVAIPIAYSDYSAVGVTSSKFYIGPYEIALDPGHEITWIDPSWTKTGNSSVSLARPIANTTYKWLNSPKYCSIKLSHPCGYQELNDSSLIDASNIYIYWSVNYATGDYAIRVTSEASKDSDTIAIINGSTGIDVMGKVPASGNTIDSNAHKSVGQALFNGVTGGFANYNPGVQSPSGNGSQLGAGCAGVFLLTPGKECFIDTEYYQPSIINGAGDASEYVSFCNRYGYPVGRFLKIGDISGFAQFTNAVVGDIASATAEDKEYINSVLNSGIYLE